MFSNFSRLKNFKVKERKDTVHKIKKRAVRTDLQAAEVCLGGITYCTGLRETPKANWIKWTLLNLVNCTHWRSV